MIKNTTQGRPKLLDQSHPVDRFDCGDGALNQFLAVYAWPSQRSGSSRTYVSLRVEEVTGFYTLAAGSISFGDAPDRLKKGQPQHDLPMILLARLAVAAEFQGCGLGAGLLRDALLRSQTAAEIIGARGIVVDAKDEKSSDFYQKFGFTPFTNDQLKLFVLFKDIRRMLADST